MGEREDGLVGEGLAGDLVEREDGPVEDLAQPPSEVPNDEGELEDVLEEAHANDRETDRKGKVREVPANDRHESMPQSISSVLALGG